MLCSGGVASEFSECCFSELFCGVASSASCSSGISSSFIVFSCSLPSSVVSVVVNSSLAVECIIVVWQLKDS